VKNAFPSLSRSRLGALWKRFRAVRAAQKGDYDRAVQLLDAAAAVVPLGASNRVYRGDLLLRAERRREAHAVFAALRNEFKGSPDPNLQYLRHYYTHKLSVLTPGSAQWSHEAKQANRIDCSALLRARFPMVTVDELHERIVPLR
jgi:hypothetical protein